MSRVGKDPIGIPEGVKINVLPNGIEVEGPKGKLISPLLPGIEPKLENDQLVLTRKDDSKQTRSFHGLNRTLAFNAIQGVSSGFTKQLEIVGVGHQVWYKPQAWNTPNSFLSGPCSP